MPWWTQAGNVFDMFSCLSGVLLKLTEERLALTHLVGFILFSERYCLCCDYMAKGINNIIFHVLTRSSMVTGVFTNHYFPHNPILLISLQPIL